MSGKVIGFDLGSVFFFRETDKSWETKEKLICACKGLRARGEEVWCLSITKTLIKDNISSGKKKNNVEMLSSSLVKLVWLKIDYESITFS